MILKSIYHNFNLRYDLWHKQAEGLPIPVTVFNIPTPHRDVAITLYKAMKGKKP